MIPIEQYKEEYIEFKRSVLLEEDIKLLNSLTELINRLSKTTDKNELIQLETDIAVLEYKMAGILGRLIGHFNTEKDSVKKEIAEFKQNLQVENPKMSIPSREEQADIKFADKYRRQSMFGAVIQEYRAKQDSLFRINSAVRHRLMGTADLKEDKKPVAWLED